MDDATFAATTESIASIATAATTATTVAEEQDGPKAKRELPEGAVATLKAWMLSPEHITHPYPTPQDQAMLMQKTGIDKKQLKNWFTNARRRIWKPLLKKQLEQGQLQLPAMGAAAGGVGAVTGGGNGGDAAAAGALAAAWAKSPQPPVAPAAGQPSHGMPPADGSANVMQQQQQQQQQPTLQPCLHDVYSAGHQQQYGRWPQGQGLGQGQQYGQWPGMAPFNSMGVSLPPNAPNNVTDSHAVLMELFARDQELGTSFPPCLSTSECLNVITHPPHPFFAQLHSSPSCRGCEGATRRAGCRGRYT